MDPLIKSPFGGAAAPPIPPGTVSMLTFPHCCSSGERKRSTQGPNFTASYVRVYALKGGDTFAVSELQFWDTSGKLISVNTPTYGPEPLVTNGEFAPEGHSSTDKSYAFILPPCQKDKGGGGHSQARYARPRRLRRRPL